MNLKNSIPSPMLAAAVTILQPYAPELNAEKLVCALKSVDIQEKKMTSDIEKPLTKKETTEILLVTMPTLDKLIKEGKIKAVKLGRLVRIDRASVYALLYGTETTAR